MSVRRFAAAVAAAGFTAALAGWPAPAQAHGAPVNPVNRASVCAVAGGNEDLAVCRAALAANGRPFGNFDNLRVPGVAGKDRQFIPDGQLCSASLPEFRGLDLISAEWPATKAVSGATMAVQYRATIAHPGSFRLYLTTAAYDPATALRWQDLGTEPILTVTDPPLRDGAYRMTAQLPGGLSGRHILYTVWQTSDSPDTYYSCSDLLLTGGGGGGGTAPGPADPGPADPGPGVPGPAAPPAASAPAAPKPTATPSTPARSDVPASPTGPAPPAVGAPAPPIPAGDRARESWLGRGQPIADDRIALGQQLVSAALVVLVGVTFGLAMVRMRAARAAQGVHRRAEKR